MVTTSPFTPVAPRANAERAVVGDLLILIRRGTSPRRSTGSAASMRSTRTPASMPGANHAGERRRHVPADGVIERPQRLAYLTSGMTAVGAPTSQHRLDGPQRRLLLHSKLSVTMLALGRGAALAERREQMLSTRSWAPMPTGETVRRPTILWLGFDHRGSGSPPAMNRSPLQRRLPGTTSSAGTHRRLLGTHASRTSRSSGTPRTTAGRRRHVEAGPASVGYS